ncbi:hypothetical protein DW089_09100 [Acidaminococcus sp. AM05-11]|jgi:hypothetical protein|nr:hypothetical protein DW089_09100 [Acidaminococcus sp. AM05-11]
MPEVFFDFINPSSKPETSSRALAVKRKNHQSGKKEEGANKPLSPADKHLELHYLPEERKA